MQYACTESSAREINFDLPKLQLYKRHIATCYREQCFSTFLPRGTRGNFESGTNCELRTD